MKNLTANKAVEACWQYTGDNVFRLDLSSYKKRKNFHEKICIFPSFPMNHIFTFQGHVNLITQQQPTQVDTAFKIPVMKHTSNTLNLLSNL